MTTVNEPTTLVHEEMFRTLLRTPHRKIDATLFDHQKQFDADPNFYGKLAVYAVLQGNCVIRDTNEIFIAVLLNSPYKAHKEAGYVMFQDLPPYQAARVARIFTGYTERVKHPSYEGNIAAFLGVSETSPDNFGVSWELAKYGDKHPDETKRGRVKPPVTVKIGARSPLRKRLLKEGKISSTDTEFTVQEYVVNHNCLGNRNFKGALRAAAKSYLKRRELDATMMEGALIRGSKYIKTFYIRTNTLPQNDEYGWINQYLWNEVVVEGSRLAALKSLQVETDPTKQAEIIVNYKLPRTLVTSVVSNITPSIWVAFLAVMSPQELLQSLGWFKKQGAFDNSDVKALIDDKLKKAKKVKKTRIDALKGSKAAEAVEGLDAETRKLVTDVTDAQLKQHSSITLRTALLIDKSFSMHEGIELGKLVGSVLAQACVKDNPPITYMFDNMATLIEWDDEEDEDITTKSAWDSKLEMFKARGGTAPHTAIRAMIEDNRAVDQIVIVTDEGENQDRRGESKFVVELKNYENKIGHMPNVVIVRIGRYSSDRMTAVLKANNINIDVLPCKDADSIAIPNLIQFCSRKSIFGLVQEILSLKLPKRSKWDEKHLQCKELVV